MTNFQYIGEKMIKTRYAEEKINIEIVKWTVD